MTDSQDASEAAAGSPWGPLDAGFAGWKRAPVGGASHRRRAVKTGLAGDAQGRRHHGRRQRPSTQIAEEAGACAVMALERVPADIRRTAGGGMSDPAADRRDPGHGHHPVMAEVPHRPLRSRPQILEPSASTSSTSRSADAGRRENHSTSGASRCPLCAARATWARRCAGSRRGGDDPHQGRGRAPATWSRRAPHRAMTREIRAHQRARAEELTAPPRSCRRPYELVAETAAGTAAGGNFSAGGIATPADAALMMQLGCDGNFVGSGIFKSRTAADGQGHRHRHHLLRQAGRLLEASTGLGQAMRGLEIGQIPREELLAGRGW